MADIVRRIPWQISDFGTPGVGGSYNLQDYQFDYAIGGIPFLSATRDAWPYTEGMAEIRKDQFDNFAEPGEQSLTGWWLRSQSTFNYGAGVLYQDPDNDNQFNYRFHDSLGVDPWTSGELKLLKVSEPKAVLASTVDAVRGYVTNAGVDAAWVLDGVTLRKYTDAAITSITSGAGGTALGLSSTGVRYFVQTTTGIWSGKDAGAGALLWNAPAGAATGTIQWAKDRIFAAWNQALYALPIAGGPAIPTSALIYTHPDDEWVWTSITEGPSAVYAAGRNTTMSAIYKFVPSIDGTTEVWTPTITAQMPYGETVNTIYGYVGAYMGIATSAGFRVGEFDGNGDVVYGPLLFQPDGGCSGIVGYDRFMWTGSVLAHEGQSGTFRVDLGTQIQEQTTKATRYAYARDVYAIARTARISSVCMLGASDRLVMTLQGSELWVQHAANLYPQGYLQTGRIRFNTEEPKLFKFASLRTPSPLQGSLRFTVISQEGDDIDYITYGPAFPPGQNDVGTPDPAGPQSYISLKFTLLRNGTDPTVGAVLNGWQIKALPGSIRQRMIQHTWLLFDEESDKGYQRVGTDGYARQRLTDFQALARAGDVVVFQELVEDLATLVIIDDWKFTQTAPPGPSGSSLGGYLTVTLRTVAEST